MDIADLTEEMHRFVKKMGWYESNSPKPQIERNLAISLLIEASEVLEHYQWTETSPDKCALESELADVALYLLQLASVSEIDLEEAILVKLRQNYERTW
jgi:NTP pyrophosphatase (non-canonical NTP hydrolase)